MLAADWRSVATVLFLLPPPLWGRVGERGKPRRRCLCLPLSLRLESELRSSRPRKGGGNERARLGLLTREVRNKHAQSSRAPVTLLRLHQRAVIEAAVEPVLIARDVLLHRDIDIGLIERNARNIGECQVDKTLHVGLVG